jgi:hypothetical protein
VRDAIEDLRQLVEDRVEVAQALAPTLFRVVPPELPE